MTWTRRLRPMGRAGALCALWAALLAAAGAAPAQNAQDAKPNVLERAIAGRAAGESGGAKPIPLVHVDEQMASVLAESETMIGQGRYDEAIRNLQALIQHPDSGFFQESAKRFVSLRRKANEVIGRLGPQGLRLYRGLYDPQAQRLYQEAMASDHPEAMLRRLSQEYFHTTYGPKALETLASTYFDQGRFSQAASCWRQLLGAESDSTRRAVLLAKIATACHLGGEPAAAQRVIDKELSKHAGASATLGGRERRLVDFLAEVQKLPAAAEVDLPRERVGWPGLGGVPDGLGRMGDCDVVLAPRWRQPTGRISSSDDLVGRILAGASMYLSSAGNSSSPYGPNHPMRWTVSLKKGHLYLGSPANRGGVQTPLPALVQPVVVGEQVICRLDDKVAAYDLLTGQRAWDTFGSLPMVRRQGLSTRRYRIYSGYRYVGDLGRYALTVGGGKVFTVYDFLPLGNSSYAFLRAQNASTSEEFMDNSSLAALSLKAEGSLLWRVGRGQGSGETVRLGKFLSAPTYSSGRLYVLVLYLQRYRLVCLDADNEGAMIWEVPVAQEPALSQRYGIYQGDQRNSIGSPPAVVDGRVYVTTNSGVVAAFEAETGQPIWAYQYSDKPITSVMRPVTFRPGYPNTVAMPPNPVVVAGGKVICLPADSPDVVALGAEKGELVWTVSRQGQQDLSAIDAGRVLLSGPKLFVLPVAGKGTELYRAQNVSDICGRPAVTPTAVLASAQDEVIRLDLKDYRLSKTPLAASDGLLGNLVSADGKLVAANMLGLCTYFSYEVAEAELSRRLAEAQPPDRAELLHRRAQLAFDARRFDVALKDLQVCRDLAQEHNLTSLAAQLPSAFYRTYVALGNHAGDSRQMRERFLEARPYAQTVQDKAHLQLRLAKCHERAGEYATAADLAQDLGEKYDREELVDVQIGSLADDSVRQDEQTRRVHGDKLARDYIRGLIEKCGRECYAKYDAMAKEALDKARAAGDLKGLLDVASRWPNSEWTDDALFAAAEQYYARAEGEPEKAEDHLAEARRHLYRVARMTDSPLRISASVGLATIYARSGWVTSAANECGLLHGLPPETAVAFGNVKGTLQDVLKLIEDGKLAVAPKPMRFLASIKAPVERVFAIAGDDVVILRDQEMRPVRVGEKIAVIKGGDAYLLDPAAEGPAEATASWKGLAGIDSDELKKRSYFSPGMSMVGGLSRDGKVMAVADRKTVRGLELVSAKVLWQKQMDKLGIATFYCMGTGEGVLVIADSSGKVVCLDIADGQTLWESTLSGPSRNPAAPPTIQAGIVLLRHNGGRTVTCFSLSRKGRIIGRWAGAVWSQCDVTADGLLVLMIDGVLSIREKDQPDKPLWEHKYDVKRFPAILGVSTEMVAVSPDKDDGTIEVLSIPGVGRKVASLRTDAVYGAVGVPFDAHFEGGNVYVLCTAGLTGNWRKSLFGRHTTCRGLSLQKFAVAGEKRLWSRDIENQAQYYPAVLPMTLGREHVVVTARHNQVPDPYYAYVLEAETGKVVQKIDLREGAAMGAQENRRLQSLGPPVMTAGRLCAETCKGVTVYGDR